MGWGLTAELQPIHMHRGFDENAITQCYLLQGRCRSQEHRTSECKYGRKDLHPFDSFGANARCDIEIRQLERTHTMLCPNYRTPA